MPPPAPVKLSLSGPCAALTSTPLGAETSQAKGRVERAYLTLQDRLV